jgi:hypothetical protein
MPFQPPVSAAPPLESTPPAEPRPQPASRPAPVWLQRLSLVVLVTFCLYLGFMVAVLPWWPQVWENNTIVLNHSRLAAWLRLGAVRGVLSGVGLLDIWIGISEAIHYRDYRG